MHRILFIIMLWLCFKTYSQALDTISPPYEPSTEIIPLDEVWVFGREPIFRGEEARKRYYLLRFRVEKVYRYAKLAADELHHIERVLDTMPRNRDKKRYTKQVQEQTEQKFTEELKKLSRSQGRILIKLIYRQTGQSAFDLVKNLRSGWRAFLYNKTAWFYDLSLKSIYDPMNVEEDFWIEDILQRGFSNGRLEPQPPAISIDFQKLEDKWRKNPVYN